MKIQALMAENFVRPAVLEEMRAQAEKVGMTKLWRHRQRASTTSLGDAHTPVPQYMTILIQRYSGVAGSNAMTSI